MKFMNECSRPICQNKTTNPPIFTPSLNPFYNYASESDPPKNPYPTTKFKGFEMTNETKSQVLEEAPISWINFYDFAA